MPSGRLTTLHCRGCGAICTTDDRFCARCGSRLPRACAHCGFPNPHDSRYCIGCGVGQGAPSEERKHVTVLFADIEGSTGMIAGIDPELAGQKFEPALGAMRRAVARFGGTVNRVAGDGIMALFGAPAALEDHAIRACCAALEMTRMVAELGGQGARIRVGLHSGEVVVRAIDNDYATDYDAIGDTTHLAHRLEQMAGPNSCWISGETRRLAESCAETRPVGTFSIEGFPQPVEAYALVACTAFRAPFDTRSGRGLSSFVGRPLELEKLLGRAQAAASGRGGAIIVSGEPGIGKSRLCREMVARAKVLGMHVVVSAAAASDAPGSYGLIGRWLRAWLGVRSEDDQASVEGQLDAFLARASIGAEHLPALQSLLDLRIRDAGWRQLDPAQRAARIDAALIEVVQSASRSPQLAVLEDLHLADDRSLAALRSLAPVLAGRPFLLVLTHRPEAPIELDGSESRLELGPLPEPDALELLSALMGSGKQLDDLKTLIAKRASGNPLFLEESVRTLDAKGHLTGEPGAFDFHGHLRTLNIPASIQDIIASRIDALEPELKATLQTAAVVGQQFTLRLVREASDDADAPLEARLGRLEAGGFLLLDAGGEGESYAFKHALTRQVAYESLLGPRRRELHGRVMEAIERVHGDRAAEHTHELAEHAFAGRLWNQAARYRLRSCQVAIERSASREAIARFERAVEELDEMPESQTTLRAGIDLRIVVLNAFLPVGEHARMLRTLLEAEKLAQSIADERRLALVRTNLAMAYWLAGNHRRGLETAETARASAERLENSAILVGSTFTVGIIHHALGAHRRSQEIQRSLLEQLRGAREADRMNWGGYPVVFVRTFLGQSCIELGCLDEAFLCATEGRALARRYDHPYSLAMIDSVAGQVLLAQKRPDEACELLSAALKASIDHEILTMRPLLAARLATAQIAMGRLDDATATIEPVLDPTVYERSGMYIWGDVFLAASDVYAARGQLAEAARFARDTETLCRRTGAMGQLAHALVRLVETADRNGSRTTADALRREAFSIATSLEMVPLLRRLQAQSNQT
jgi:class 3 adenylate cyclase/tetratricopeptide (TPR) repeat protein